MRLKTKNLHPAFGRSIGTSRTAYEDSLLSRNSPIEILGQASGFLLAQDFLANSLNVAVSWILHELKSRLRRLCTSEGKDCELQPEGRSAGNAGTSPGELAWPTNKFAVIKNIGPRVRCILII